jgi:hypothetical protein
MYLLEWIFELLRWLPTLFYPENLLYTLSMILTLTCLGINLANTWSQSKLQNQGQASGRKLDPITQLELDLLSLCQGDKELARRLYRHAKGRYPGRDKKWYLDRTISDIYRDRKIPVPNKYTSQAPTTSASKSQTVDPIFKINGILEGKILRLLQGDRELAIRLLKNVKERTPGQSYEWYLQKVIWDLERDRRI